MGPGTNYEGKPQSGAPGVLGLILFTSIVCWGQTPELVVQTGHSNFVSAVAFSPDRKTLASGSWDNTVKLWDVATGIELRTLKGHSSPVRSVAFSPDGKTLAGSGDNTIKLWDIMTGTELRTLKGHMAVFSIAFSRDGKTLAGGDYNTVKLWDVSTGALLRIFKGHSTWVNSVAFSPDGKTIASGSQDTTVKLWQGSTGTVLLTLKGHSKSVTSVAFSSDGRTLASGSEDSTVKVWDITTGKELRTLSGHSGPVDSVAFSPDGRTLASGSRDATVELWEVSTGAELRTLKGHSSPVRSVAISTDGKTLAGGCDDNTVRLWDISTGRELRTFKEHSDGVRSIAFTVDGKTLASGSNDNTVKLWDISTGAELRTLKGHSDTVTSVAFSPDGKTLASGSTDWTVKLWDVSTGTELRTLKGHSYFVDSVAFSPDGKTLASAGWDNTVRLWDVTTGNELRTIEGHSSVAFSSDGKTLASGGSDNTVKLWDIATGTELRTFKGHSSSVNSIAFSPDGKTLASGGNDHTVKLWNIATGTELRTLKGHSYVVSSVAFSPDGKTLASGSSDWTVKLWDVLTGTELHTLKKHSDGVYSVAFSLNNKYLLSGSVDTTIKIWEVSSGKELASLIALDEKDWVVVTPEGLFDGSPSAWNQLVWRLDNNTFNCVPVEAFFNEFFYPGLLTEIMAGKRPQPSKKDLSAVDIRQPHLRITRVGGQAVIQDSPGQLASVAAPVSDRKVEVTLEITDNVKAPSRPAHPKTSGAQDVRLFRNGSLVKLWSGDAFGKESQCQQLAAQEPLAPPRRMCTVTVTLVAGENRLTGYAFNADNVKSNDATVTVTGAESLNLQGTAYLLAVGVNNYSNSGYNLKYAVPDALEFSAEVKRRLEALRRYAQVEVISLSDSEATKANITRKLTELSARVRPEDTVIVYFAGHGTAQQNRFYLIPHDLGYDGPRTRLNEAGLQAILAHSISDMELDQAFEKIDARQILLVIDACNSGQALEAEEKRRGPMNSKGLAQLAYEKGMYVLAAAQSYQAAQEAEKLGHGFLTYALVEDGLKAGTADREPKDGRIELREWLNYATDQVPRMQEENMLEALRGRGRFINFVGDGTGPQGPGNSSVQRPRTFYRRELESNPLVVAILGATAPQ